MEKSESIKNIALAMNKAQSEMGGAHKGANNPFFKSKYADLGAVIEVVKVPFADNGLSYVQFPINDGDRVGVETILMHSSGEWLSGAFTVKASKQDAQGAGSVITYCKRYGLQAIAGIPSEDDDGNEASKVKLNTPVLMGAENLTLIRKEFNEILTEGGFCSEWNLNKLEDLHAASFDNAIKYIKEQS
jgi:hypothetical protein